LADVDSALALTEALLEGGLTIMEITFRTSATAPAISAIAKKYPEMTIGAGTILSSEQVTVAKDAGAKFGLAPGFNNSVIYAARSQNLFFIPGVATPTEIDKALDQGFDLLKVFPAGHLGGRGYLKSLQGPYKSTGVHFIPMGGVGLLNIATYFQCLIVTALGGSWLVPQELIENRQFSEITSIVRKSMKIILKEN
jgi:2-dehydro-3-deoxyphosphogluconate aldolase/(4S)-4-hydroxy-2-oxoglutarate aldolase